MFSVPWIVYAIARPYGQPDLSACVNEISQVSHEKGRLSTDFIIKIIEQSYA